MTRKFLLNVLMVIVLAFGFVPVVQADSPSPTDVPKGPHSAIDPNYRPTKEELAGLAVKDKAAKEYAKGKTSGITPMRATGSVYVGYAEQFREEEGYGPQLWYCGPTSTQVALRAKMTTVPDSDTIAEKENFDYGVSMQDITTALNYYLGYTYYYTGQATSSSQLEYWNEYDVDLGYAMITGLKTYGMPGWGTTDAYHIVAMYGYDTDNGSKVRYVDTASDDAGHVYADGGTYFNLAYLSDFWNWVLDDNIQSWQLE